MRWFFPNLMIFIVISGQSQVLRAQMRDEIEHAKVDHSRGVSMQSRSSSEQKRGVSRTYQDKAKTAEAIAEAYQAIADAERAKAELDMNNANRKEDRRQEWDRLSIKGNDILNRYAELCLNLEVSGRGPSYIESCVAHHVVRELGYEACLRYQGLSDGHEYRGRHCYAELKHAFTKCLNRQFRNYDLASCIHKSGHFPHFYTEDLLFVHQDPLNASQRSLNQ